MSLVFGRDYMPARDAEHAPAWPSLRMVESRREAAYKRQLKLAERDLATLVIRPHRHVPGTGEYGSPRNICWDCKAVIE